MVRKRRQEAASDATESAQAVGKNLARTFDTLRELGCRASQTNIGDVVEHGHAQSCRRMSPAKSGRLQK
jgi:hypothetical protein